MTHFAKVESGIVTKVIVAEPQFFDTFVDDSPGQWVQTSYNMRGGIYYDPETRQPADQSVIEGNKARERKNYAGVGWHYDGVGFYPPQPYASWTLNKSTYLWDCPIVKPELTEEEIAAGSYYAWDESAHQTDNATGWVLKSPSE